MGFILGVLMTQREEILNKSCGRCFYCGEDLTNKKWQKDHFHPVIRVDGVMRYPQLDTLDNLVASCAPCNNFKSSLDVEDYRDLIKDQFVNVPKYNTGIRQLIRLGLVDISEKAVIFHYEKEGLEVPDLNTLLSLHKDTDTVEWKKDPSEHYGYYSMIDDNICSLRHEGKEWWLMITDTDWCNHLKKSLTNARYVFKIAASDCLKILRPE